MTPARLALACLCAGLAAAPLAAVAQDAAPADGTWTGTGELGLALSRGNSRSENLNTKLKFAREDDRWKHDFGLTALRSKGEVSRDLDGDGVDEDLYETTANRYAADASSAYKFDPRNSLVGALRYEHDDFSSYDYQATFSVGYGRQWFESEETALRTEIGPGFRRARVAETGEVENGAIVRGTLDYRRQLTANTALTNEFLVEAGSDNTFLQNDLAVAVAMNEAFALKAGLQARHNTEVDEAAGVEKTDTLTTVNLVYTFR